MSTQLERFLQSIDPAETIDETSARMDDAINSFRGLSARITDWEEFHHCLAEFLSHIENRVLRLRGRRSADLEFDGGRCVQYLLDEYGLSGEKAAFEMARTGNEGGLYAVLKTLARHIAQDYSRNEIAARVSAFLRGLTLDEQLAVAREYLDKYGHLLPSELTEGSAARLRANFTKVLEEHPYLIRRFGRVGR